MKPEQLARLNDLGFRWDATTDNAGAPSPVALSQRRDGSMARFSSTIDGMSRSLGQPGRVLPYLGPHIPEAQPQPPVFSFSQNFAVLANAHHFQSPLAFAPYPQSLSVFPAAAANSAHQIILQSETLPPWGSLVGIPPQIYPVGAAHSLPAPYPITYASTLGGHWNDRTIAPQFFPLSNLAPSAGVRFAPSQFATPSGYGMATAHSMSTQVVNPSSLEALVSHMAGGCSNPRHQGAPSRDNNNNNNHPAAPSSEISGLGSLFNDEGGSHRDYDNEADDERGID